MDPIPSSRRARPSCVSRSASRCLSLLSPSRGGTVRRPRTAPLASITCHLRWSKFTFGKCVFISNPDQKRGQNSKPGAQVNRHFNCFALSFAGHPVKSAPFSGMNPSNSLLGTPNRRIALIAVVVVALDQITKQIVLRLLGYAQEKVVIEGFFKFVHWGNTGAAWSLFRGNNGLLAGVALIALLVLFLSRHQFDSRTLQQPIDRKRTRLKSRQ